MSCNYRNGEKVVDSLNELLFLFKVAYFDLQNYNPIYIFIGQNQKVLIQRQGFSEAGCDGTRSAPSALYFVPRCLQSALSRRPKLRFGPDKIINSILFSAGCNNVLELISNSITGVYFLL